MNKTTQRAVIIDNISSPYVDHAIIILKDYSPMCQSKIIKDAEKIVRDYLENIKSDDSDITLYSGIGAGRKRKKKKRKAPAAYALMYLAAALGIVVIFKLVCRLI